MPTPNASGPCGTAGRLQRAAQSLFRGLWRAGQQVWAAPRAFVGVVSRPGSRTNSGRSRTGTKRDRRAGEKRDWAQALEDEKGLLLELVRGMEAEFLANGSGLRRLAQQLTSIQKECQALGELTLGEGEDDAVRFAFQLLKKSEDLVLASYDQFDQVFGAFENLQKRLSLLAKQHEELMRVLLPLNLIATSFRIEASRHPPVVEQVFCTLAADVKRMLNEFRGTVEREFEQLAQGEKVARKLMGQVTAAVQQHRKEVAGMLTTSRDHLRALRQALSNSGAGTADLSRINQAVTRHIGGLVMAQQCQDITRQKVEHVGKALDLMRDRLQADSRPGFGSSADTRQFVFRAGQIQLQQVRSVFHELHRAAESLKSGIQDLRNDAAAAAATAQQVADTSLDEKIGSECQANIGELLDIVSQSVRTIADILAAFEPLQALFTDYTTKATALANDVRYAALNAQIFAANAADGNTLEVMAHCLRVVSDEAREKLDQLGESLQETAQLVNNVRQRLSDFQHLGQADQKLLAEESATSRKKLSELEGVIPERIRRITQQQAAVAKSVDEVLANVRFPDLVAEAEARSTDVLQRLVDWGGRNGAAPSPVAETDQDLDRLHSNYTMESERTTHSVVLQKVTPPTVVENPRPIRSSQNGGDGSPSMPRPSLGTQAPHKFADVTPLPDPGRTTTISKPEPTPSAPPAKSETTEDFGDNVELF
jgi:hypothetical protein